MNIKRYTRNPADGIMSEDDMGEWVSWKDYEWMSNYADRLVEHSSMVCLPKDLANLRGANLAFAIENEILRNEIKQIRSITETKGCFCKRKFVKQIPSLSHTYTTKETTHTI